MQFLENRIPPPIVALLFAAMMWVISLTVSVIELGDVSQQVIVFVLVIMGLLFCVAGVVSFRRAETTVNPLKPESASSLVDSGIYRVSRNPMYVGFALILCAWTVYLSAALPFLGVIGFVLYMNKFQIVPEERALTNIFGYDFTEYQSKVRRWL